MPWIPEEEIKRAREITAIEYLKKYQPNRRKNLQPEMNGS